MDILIKAIKMAHLVVKFDITIKKAIMPKQNAKIKSTNVKFNQTVDDTFVFLGINLIVNLLF